MGVAKRTIVAVFLLVPLFCIPNYLSFAIVKDLAEQSNVTIYKVSSNFGKLARRKRAAKTPLASERDKPQTMTVGANELARRPT